MNEDTFPIELAGRRWTLPHLPFRAIKAIQPALFQIYAEAGGGDVTPMRLAGLNEAQLERLAEAVWRGVAHVEPGLSFEAFQELSFSVADLIRVFPEIAGAAGLQRHATPATAEASPESGK